MQAKHPTQFQQQASARTAIVRSDKADRVERLCIVMGTQQKRGRRAPLPRESRNEIQELNFAAWRVVRECLPRHLPTRESELILDVIPGFFDGPRPGRTRPEINEPLDMSQSFLTGKLFPNLRLRRTPRLSAQCRDNEKNQSRPTQSKKETKRGATSLQPGSVIPVGTAQVCKTGITDASYSNCDLIHSLTI
jgi:hypothetical protein